MTSATDWMRMSLGARIRACNVDIMLHPEFALLSGIVCMGKVIVRDDIPTAGTDGFDVFYGEGFCKNLNQKQLRYIILHENFHKALRHCTEYRDVVAKYPELSNKAQDYVINLMIEEADPRYLFVERPISNLCIDRKYTGLDFIAVLRDLLKQTPDYQSVPLDKHMDGSQRINEDNANKVASDIDDALRQGRIARDRIRARSKGGDGRALDGLIQNRQTNWTEAMREFIQTLCAGDENSRFCPPNKRFLPLGIVMPSHFSESVGDLILACDTSGSMTSVYPVVFGEIARICETTQPDTVRVIWWDSVVRGEQVFTRDDYDKIATLLSPKGGGGTTVSCVAEYIAEKQYKPKAAVYLTDGYIESDYTMPSVPCLWGVVNNTRFTPRVGKKVNINSTL